MNVIVSGLPEDVSERTLVRSFRSNFRSHRIRKFWINEIVSTPGSFLKSTVIEFFTPDDALLAVRLINDFVLETEHANYCLAARIDKAERRYRSVSPRNHERRESMRERENRFGYRGDRYSRRYSRERSRSPQISSSYLDLEIELLRKQRMIVEEERRLMLERKKLELVKEFGPRALNEFQFEEPREHRGRRSRLEREPRPRRPSPLQIRYPPTQPWLKRQRTRAPLNDPPTVPLFLRQCTILVKEMKPAILKHVSKKEFSPLMKFLKSTLRKRMALALDKKPYMSGVEIVKLYRELYPASTDEDLIKTHLKDLKMFNMPVKKDTKKDDKDADKSTVKGKVHKEITKENESSNKEMTDVKEGTETKKKVAVKNKVSEANKKVLAKTEDPKVKNEETEIAKVSKVKDEEKEISDDGKIINTETGNVKQEDDDSRNDNENVDSDTVPAATDKKADIDEEEKCKADNNEVIETKIEIVNQSVEVNKTKEKEIIVKDVVKVKKAIVAVGKPIEKVNKGIKGFTKASIVVKTEDAEDDKTERENLDKTAIVEAIENATPLDATVIAPAMDDDDEEDWGGEVDWNAEDPEDEDSMDL